MFDFIREHQMNIMLALSYICFSFGFLLFITRFLDKKRKIILILMEFIAAFLLFFDRLAYLYSGNISRTATIMTRVSNFFVFFLTSAIVHTFNQYIIYLLKEGKVDRIPLRIRISSIGSIVGMLLVIVSQFTGLFYSIDEANVYHRGPGFLLSYIIPVLCPLIQFSVIWQYRKVFSKLIYTSLVLYIFVPIVMGIIQIFEYGISIVNMAMVAVSISLYVFTYLDINEEVSRAHQIEIGELKEGEQRMKRLFDQTASAFVMAVEKRDPYTNGHSVRVAEVARKIAQHSGKDEAKCEEVYYAALLHDVGLIGIPDSIIEKRSALSEEEQQIIRRKPIIGSEILSDILEYPYLYEAAKYCNERYDGTGYPDGLKGEAIPETARIIAVADAYDAMTMGKNYREAFSYLIAREELVEKAGTQFDPDFAGIMVQIIDTEDVAKAIKTPMESEIFCGRYKDTVTAGVELTDNVIKLTFDCELKNVKEGDFSAPSILMFDSYDNRYHDNPNAMQAYRYYEYGEFWFDGNYVSTGVRNMEVTVLDNEDSGLADNHYEIIGARYDDHVKLEITSSRKKIIAIVALYDNTKASYVGLTGENCHIYNIFVEETSEKTNENSIKRLTEPISFTDRLEADIPNIQVDKWRSASTAGIKIIDELRIKFHAQCLPVAELIWHCPYIVIFTSEDGMVNGKGYKEYGVIKLNGEITGDDILAKNEFSMKKKDYFKGWDDWKKNLKEGIEVSVLVIRKGNKIIISTENLGIAIENTTVIKNDSKAVYVALTGDIVALTDIRVLR